MIACAPEILEDTAVLSVGHKVGYVLITVILGCVAVPEVVGGHIAHEPCVVDLPPAATFGDLEIASAHVRVNLFLALEISVEVLGAANVFSQEVVARRE